MVTEEGEWLQRRENGYRGGTERRENGYRGGRMVTEEGERLQRGENGYRGGRMVTEEGQREGREGRMVTEEGEYSYRGAIVVTTYREGRVYAEQRLVNVHSLQGEMRVSAEDDLIPKGLSCS